MCSKERISLSQSPSLNVNGAQSYFKECDIKWNENFRFCVVFAGYEQGSKERNGQGQFSHLP